MKVTNNSPDLLIVEDRPWLFGVLLAGGALAPAGGGIAALLKGEITGLFFILGSAFLMLFFYFFVRRTQAVFHARQGWMEIRQRTLFGYTKIRHDIAEIERAIIETSTDGDGGATHRVTFIIPSGQSAGRHPLTQVYSSGNGAANVTRAINSWLDSHRQAT